MTRRMLPALLLSSPHAQGWAASLLLHAAAVATAVTQMSGLSVPPERESFRWEVSLVEPFRPELPVQTKESPVPVQAKESPVESVRPLPADVAPVPMTQPGTVDVSQPALAEPSPVPAKPVESALVAQAVEPVTAAVDPVPAPAVETVEPEPVAPDASQIAEPVEPVLDRDTGRTSQAVEPVERRAVAEEPAKPAPPQEVARTSEPAEPPRPSVAAEVPLQQPSAAHASQASLVPPAEPVAMARPPATDSAGPRADFGWLARSLWERVTELKRYPHRARLNHWEGKVVLRAVIRHDGHLADLTIHESSGYEVLDEAALELVREACPLHLKEPLGQQQVVVLVPITYALR